VDADARIGVRRLEFREQRRERVAADGQRRTDIEAARAGRGELRHFSFERLDVAQDGARTFDQKAPRVGEERPALDDLHERHAEMIRERPNLQRDRGRRDAQVFGGSSERPELGEPEERVKLRQGESHPHLLRLDFLERRTYPCVLAIGKK
jgi:hypothetical protein